MITPVKKFDNTREFYLTKHIVYYQIENIPKKYKLSADPTLPEIKNKLNVYLDDLENKASKQGIKLSLIVGFPSYKKSIVKGYAEVYDLFNQDTKNAVSDWQYQADLYETFFEAAENRKQINKIIVAGYWWDDAMDPDNTKVRISIHPSIRNKPAEAVFKKWAYSLVK